MSVQASGTANEQRLYTFSLARQVHGAERMARNYNAIWRTDCAFLQAAWDVLRITPAELWQAPEAPLDEHRVTYAWGPVHGCLASIRPFLERPQSQDRVQAWLKELEPVAQTLPFIAYCELRGQDGPLSLPDVGAAQAFIQQLAARVAERCQSACPRAEWGVFLGLGHADVCVLFAAPNLAAVGTMIRGIRTLTLGDVGCPEVLSLLRTMDAKRSSVNNNHAFAWTLTHAGFFGHPKDTTEGGQPQERKPLLALDRFEDSPHVAPIVPAMLITLQPGHEVYASELAQHFGEEVGHRCSVTTGSFDLRVECDTHVSTNDRTTMAWLLSAYDRLLENAPHDLHQHVRAIQTMWQFDVPRQADERSVAYVPHASIDMQPPIWIKVPAVLHSGPGPTSWVALHSVVRAYQTFASSSFYARHLRDVGFFLEKLVAKVGEVVDHGSGLTPIPGDMYPLISRSAMILVNRIAGGSSGQEPDLVFDPGVTQQKIVAACDALVSVVFRVLEEKNPHALARTTLVGLSLIDRGRTTHWRSSEGSEFAVIELPADASRTNPRRLVCTTVHEAVHAVRRTPARRTAIQEAAIREVSHELMKRLQDPVEHRLEELMQDVGLRRDGFREDAILVTLRSYVHQASADAARPKRVLELLAASHEPQLDAKEIRLSAAALEELFDLAHSVETRYRDLLELAREVAADIVAARLCGEATYMTFLENELAAAAHSERARRERMAWLMRALSPSADTSETLTPMEEFLAEWRQHVDAGIKHSGEWVRIVQSLCDGLHPSTGELLQPGFNALMSLFFLHLSNVHRQSASMPSSELLEKIPPKEELSPG